MFFYAFCQFIILATVLIGVMSKNCGSQHIQYRYCTNEFALKAAFLTIKDSRGRYRARIMKLYSGDRSKLNINKMNRTTIVLNFNLTFAHGTTYAVYGFAKDGSIRVDYCNGIRPWRFMSGFQQVAMTDEYITGCHCVEEIGTFLPNRTCLWKTSYMKWKGGKCVWVVTNPLLNCRNVYSDLIDDYS